MQKYFIPILCDTHPSKDLDIQDSCFKHPMDSNKQIYHTRLMTGNDIRILNINIYMPKSMNLPELFDAFPDEAGALQRGGKMVARSVERTYAHALH